MQKGNIPAKAQCVFFDVNPQFKAILEPVITGNLAIDDSLTTLPKPFPRLDKNSFSCVGPFFTRLLSIHLGPKSMERFYDYGLANARNFSENSTLLMSDFLSSAHHLKPLHQNPEPSESAPMLQRVLRPKALPHVCVVGAGLAGLRCAAVLIDHGIKVTMFEGRDRIGGRVHQNTESGYALDMGPNWIHGISDNPIFDIAKKTKTATHKSWDAQLLMDRNGNIIPRAIATKYSETMWGIIEKAMEYSVEHSSDIDPSESLFDFMSKTGKQVIDNDNEQGCGIDLKTLLECSELWSSYVGEDIRKQSLKHLFLEECIEGDNVFVAGTYKSILDHVAATALSKADLHLSTTVTSINSQTTAAETGKISVGTSLQEEKSFDEVVMTAPLGWLKRHPQVFDPPLPPRLSKAISSLGYGHLEKVGITFEDAFWESGTSSNEIGTQKNQQGLEGFVQWLSPEYAKQTNPKYFYQSALELSSLDSPNGHPTLLFYISGPCSRYLVSATKNKTPEQSRSFLRDFFQPYYSRLPHYQDQEPKCIVSSSWQTDELAGNGSYTQIPVGTTQADKDVEVIRDGLPDRRLWLAGEHTAPFLALGTTTGAYFSGEAVARRIIRAYGMEESKV